MVYVIFNVVCEVAKRSQKANTLKIEVAILPICEQPSIQSDSRIQKMRLPQ